MRTLQYFLAPVATSAALLTSLAAPARGEETVVAVSPGGQTQVEIREDGGGLTYSVRWQDRFVVRPSRLGLLEGSKVSVTRIEKSDTDRNWTTTWGQFSQIHDRHRQVTLHLDYGTGEAVTLQCRVFDDGVGLRFTSDGKAASTPDEIDFRTEFDLPVGSSMYWPQGEREPAGPVTLAAFAEDETLKPSTPVVVETGDGVFAALMESDLFSATQFKTVRFGRSDGERSRLAATSPATVRGEAWQTAWRVVLVGNSPGSLLVSTTPLNLAADCRLPDTAWINPGKALWDWRAHGYKADDFRYGIDTQSYLRFIDFASKNNIQYFLIDADWYAAVESNRLTVNRNVDLDRVMAHARERGVGVLLYYDRHKGAVDDDSLFPLLAGKGAVGIKYGFMGNNAPFTRDAIARAAAQRLLIDFHDAPVPMTGVERTMPNAITREYCHAQQDSRRAFTPTGFLKMAMINALTGPLDQANGIFDLDGVNAGEREKGPKVKQSLNSTVVSEAARVLVVYSGLAVLPDAPEAYAKKADLFDFIRRMPATWDETRVLKGEIGRHITTARRSGAEWFVGSVVDEAGGALAIPLDFLSPDTAYDVTFYADAPDAHFETNREAYRVSQGHVRRGDTITTKLAPGGGHCMWIRPAAEIAPTRLLTYKKVGDTELRLHAFEPARGPASERRPAVVFFFGGGWAGGEPKQFYQHAQALKELGVVAFSAEYRVSSRNRTTPLECVKDAKSAVRWIRAHAAELGVDPDRIVAAGGSAGGHIAACAGTVVGHDEAGEDLSVSSAPNAMILFNPVLDTTAETGFASERFSPELRSALSPCHQVRKGIVPTIVFHGTADKTVPFEQAERFARLMTEAGNDCVLVPFLGKGHGFFNGSFFRPNSDDNDFESTMKSTREFLAAHGLLNH